MPGTVALATGASPRTHGMWYDVAYSRALYPPVTSGGAADCSGPPGTQTTYDETVDRLFDASQHFTVADPSGGCASRNGVGGCGINPDALPRKLLANGSCVPWYPHNEVRVNTMYEVAKAANYLTLFSDKHLSYEVPAPCAPSPAPPSPHPPPTPPHPLCLPSRSGSLLQGFVKVGGTWGWGGAGVRTRKG